MEIFDWNHVEEIDDDRILLIDKSRTFSPAIEISKQEVLDYHEPVNLLVGMERSGWDEHREIYRTFSPGELWEDEKYSMIQDAWEHITRIWTDENENIIKIENPVK